VVATPEFIGVDVVAVSGLDVVDLGDDEVTVEEAVVAAVDAVVSFELDESPPHAAISATAAPMANSGKDRRVMERTGFT
jgi:hypothetical protein